MFPLVVLVRSGRSQRDHGKCTFSDRSTDGNRPGLWRDDARDMSVQIWDE